MSDLRAETDIITSITSPNGRAMLLVIMNAKTFKTDVINFICI